MLDRLIAIKNATTRGPCRTVGERSKFPHTPLMMRQDRKPNIGIIPHMFIERMSAFHLDELVALLNPLAEKLLIMTGGYENPTRGVEIISIRAKKRASFAFKALEQVFVHAQILRALATRRKEIDILVFFLGGVEFAIPLMFAKFLNIPCLSILAGLGNAPRIRSVKESGDSHQFGELMRLRVLTFLERLTLQFSDKLIVYDPLLIDRGDLRKYQKRITIAHRHFVDFDTYRFSADVERRGNVITYIGRLHEEKGVLNLVKAMPQVVDKRDDVHLVMIGDGHLEGEIRRYVDAHALDGRVTLTGWVPHHELPRYLSASKLLVLPSYTEGLPHAMLEAMACGTPVLATPVGAVPQIIRDNETGFIVRDNSPSSLATCIVEALASPHLARVARNARTLVQNEFQFESVLKAWRNVICDLDPSSFRAPADRV
ncbi:MAG: glycosyltransferase [Halobacteriota archaeon]